jgi:hypothetical protein
MARDIVLRCCTALRSPCHVAALAAAMGLTTVQASASELPGCGAVSQGALDVGLEDIGSQSVQAKLGAGDRLVFTLEKSVGSFASLRLVAGAGAPRTLLTGPAGGTVSFVAQRPGIFAFEIAAEGAEGAKLTAVCTLGRNARAARSPGARRAERLLAEHPNLGEVTPPEEVQSDTVEATATVLESGGTKSDALITTRPSSTGPAVAKPAGPLELYLQGQDKRYLLGQSPDKAQPGSGPVALNGGGLTYKLWPHIMVGAMVQLDQSAPGIYDPTVLSYQGWLAGPVTTVQLAPGLSLDARAAWGAASAGEVASPLSSEVERRQLNARLASTQNYGPWRFSPSVSFNYADEFYPVGSAPHEGGRQSSGQVDVRPEIGYRFDLGSSSFIEPKAAIGTVWALEGTSTSAGGPRDDLHLKAEAGVALGTTDGAKVQATGGIEEGGAGAPDIWSGRLQFQVPLK